MSEPQTIRLAKRMAELGLCSRSEADKFIERGLVRVDGVVVQVLGSRVLPDQQIELQRPTAPLADNQVTLLAHKIAGAPVSSAALIRAQTQAPDDRSNLALLPRHSRQLTLSGALDVASSGLVVLTQDPRLARKLAECEMEVLVQVEAAPEVAQLLKRLLGVRQLGLLAKTSKVTRQSDRQLRLLLSQAELERIAALCAALEVSAQSVRCIRIGRMALGNLAPGQWRYLMPYERF